MKKFSIFAVFSMFCSVCFGAPSLRASSVPLTHSGSLSAQKSIVSATGTKTDSVQTTDSLSSNESRLDFVSPLSNKPQKHYIPTNGTSYQAAANTAKEMAELQRQIDELLDKQTRMETTLPETVQSEIKNSDLTKNASFTEAVSDLQEKTNTIENFNATVSTQIDEKLVDAGLVDNNGNLQVATKSEVSPVAIAQKIADSTAAKEVLTGEVGTDENAVRELIASDLKDRGIVDNNENLKVATTETVQNLANRAITNENLDTKLNEKNVITTDNVAETNVRRALSNAGFAKTADVVATSEFKAKLKQDLADEEVKNALSTAGFATKGEVGTDENAVKDLIVSDLKKRGIVDNSENLQIATKEEITADALETKLNTKFVKPSAITADG